MKTAAILGSTGSIGRQSLEVCRHLGIRVTALVSGGRNPGLFSEQVREFRPNFSGCGSDAALLAIETGADIIVNAISGRAGLEPMLKATRAGLKIALANKESLVCAGNQIMEIAARTGAAIIPVDSEHSAIFQCLEAANGNTVKSVILTASGGPFRGMKAMELERVTLEDTLKHPVWSMGSKVTVDSATLMNKGLEYIEAMRLFSLRGDQIKVVVHPQSIVHSAVEFEDGTIIANLGSPDMRTPIQYALTYPERQPGLAKKLSLADIGSLTFEEPDYDSFPCLALAMEAAPLGDDACARLNDANERAVADFLSGKIRFTGIYAQIKEELS